MSEQTTELAVLETVKNEGLDLVKKARDLANITNPEEFRLAAEFRKLVNGFEKQAVAKAKPIRDATTAAWKAGIKLVDEAIAPFLEVKSILDGPITEWTREQDRLRRVEEEKRMAAAKKLAEEDQIARAEEAAKSGDHDRAEAIIAQPIAPPPVIMPKPEKVEGVSIVKHYGVDEVIDIRRLAQACLGGDIPIDAIQPNMTFLKKMATATKGTMKIPGVTFTSWDGVRS